MHGYSSGYALLVNAEVDSMGGVVEVGVGIGTKTSPRRAAIEKAQAELRQEYDVLEERRRELEFLEKGGNPLEFKLGNVASVSVQSTSLTDQHPEQFVTSEAKSSFALTASPPHGDSLESSGRPGASLACEPNSADNLMLFDGENESFDGEKNSIRQIRSKIAPSEHSYQLDGSQNAKELGDSAAFGLPKKAYRRRYRPRSSRDGARSSSTDALPSRGGHGSSLPSRHGPRDAKGMISDVDKQKDHDIPSNCNSKSTSPNGSVVPKTVPSDTQLDMEPDGVPAVESTTGHDAVSDVHVSKTLQDNQYNQWSQNGETPIEIASEGPESVGRREQVILTGLECPPCVPTTKVENQASSGKVNGFSSEKVNRKIILNEGQNSNAAFSTKGLDSETSCTQTSHTVDGNNDSEMCTKLRNIDTNGNGKEPISAYEGKSNIKGDQLVKDKADDSYALINDDCNAVHQNHQANGSVLKIPEEFDESGSGLQNEVKDPIDIPGMETGGFPVSETEREPSNLLGDISASRNENTCINRVQGSMDSSVQEITVTSAGVLTVAPGQGSMDSSVQGIPVISFSARVSIVAPEQQMCSGGHLKLESKADENSILEEARIIEAKRKRIAELSLVTSPMENHRKSHWDYVLEEMAWLANDFAQERLWKITAAAQLSHRAAFTSRLRFDEQNSCWKQKKIAHTLAKAVTEFWHSVEEISKELELKSAGKDFALSVQGYATRFLKYNSSYVPQGLAAEAPATPERISDCGILDMSWEDNLTEENLFYTVPPGAMEIYRKSIESHFVQCEKTSSSMQEEVETSAYDAEADFESQENAYEEDEGETSTYYLPGALEGGRSSKFVQKRRKKLTKAYGARSYVGADLPFMQCMENKVGTQQSMLMGKRPASSLNVSIPTKRVRTASRQRVPSPFHVGTSGCFLAPNKTDASSGDTNSFQDDQSTMHGGSQMPNSLEFESVVDFEKQLPFDSVEVSTKPKKKKKAKHLGSTYEQRWQLDSNFQNEQRDYSKKRSDNHQLESNGSTVASQMSNMPNPNKFIRMLGGRDRGRKAKALKMPAGQPGSGSPWSLFEDQALVVLVHDLGPNWELVSDAINSTLQFKCIFRKPKACKERHNILMDRTAGDGADSAEDSGSSQPYPSTLPGIPKGSARQLFQRLQGPMEEDTIKSHFEKIIILGQKQHFRRSQNDYQDTKQLQQPHSSHTLALSQVCPNNLNGGPILTPMDLCDTTTSSPDVSSLGYQGSHNSALAISNQGTVAPMLPASCANSFVQGSSNMILGSNFPSPSGPPNASVRDGRYGVPRTALLSVEEQQRMQQYNQMLSARNIQQSGLSIPGALQGTDHGVRMGPGDKGMRTMGGLNRSTPMVRPGFQEIASSSMLNSGGMFSSGTMVMPSPVNMRPGASSGQGNSMLRPRDSLHMMRSSQNLEPHRPMMVQELQMQVSQGNKTGVPPFGGLTSSFSNQTAPPVQSYPMYPQPHPMSQQQSHVLSNPHHQGPNHATSSQHQAYAIRFAKERHPQQRLLQQPQHQFAASNTLMPQVQPQSQLPVSSSLQNSSQIQSQTSSSPISMSHLTSSSSMTPMPSPLQQKHQMQPHGLVQNSQIAVSGLTNQIGKQRQRQAHQQQQFQQAGRHHPQQRQQSQSQHQTKLMKGLGRGNMMMHQNLPIDPSLNGLSTAPGSQTVEMHSQGLYSGSGLNPVQQSKPLVPPHSSSLAQSQQKMYSSQAPPSKPLHQMPTHSDNENQGHIPSSVTSCPTLSASHQAVPPSTMVASNHRQVQPRPQPNQKLVSQAQPSVHRVLQHNLQVNSDLPSKLQGIEAHADLQGVNNSSKISIATTMPQVCIDVINPIPVSSTNTAQWKVSDSSYDSGSPSPATQLGSIGTPPLTNSSGSEATPLVSRGLGPRQSSGSLAHLGNDVGAQWQQQSSQLQQSSPLPPSPQQSLQRQLPPQLHSQHQKQLLQAGNSGLHVRPTSSRLE